MAIFRNRSAVFISILVLILVLTGCLGSSDPTTETSAPDQESPPAQEAKQGLKSISVGITQSPSSFNPLDRTNYVNMYIIPMFFPTMVQLSEDMQFVNHIATSVETDDNQTFTVKMNDDVMWTDGVPVTADDVIFTIGMLAHPEVNALRATDYAILEGLNEVGKVESGLTADISGVQKVDDHTLKFITKNPIDMMDFQSLILQNLALLPAHKLIDVDPAQIFEHPFMQAPDISYGPFKFVNYQRDQYVELEANPDYFHGKPKIDKLFFRITSPANLVTMLESGDIDMNVPEIGRIPINDYDRIKNMPHLNTESGLPITSNLLGINHDRYGDRKIRQAFLYGINRETIVANLLLGEGEVSNNVYSPIHPYYSREAVHETYPYDPEKARALLEEANWDSGRTLTLAVSSGNSLHEQTANIIVENLRSIGVNIQIQTFDQATLIQHILSGDFDLYLWTTRFDIYPDMSRVFATGGSTNFNRYSNPVVDQLFIDGLRETDPNKRYDIYKQWQEIFNEDLPHLELFYDYRLRAVNKRVINGKPQDIGMFINVHEWDVEQ